MSASDSPTSGIFVALGANLPSAIGSPRETLEEALRLLGRDGIEVRRVSPWYETEPVPRSDQPWFVNGIAEIATNLDPEALMQRLHALENEIGRVRRERWEARVVDLDLIDYRGLVCREGPVLLPHPRATERAFVLFPLRDIAPGWRDPVSGRGIDDLIAALPAPDGAIRLLGEGGPND